MIATMQEFEVNQFAFEVTSVEVLLSNAASAVKACC